MRVESTWSSLHSRCGGGRSGGRGAAGFRGACPEHVLCLLQCHIRTLVGAPPCVEYGAAVVVRKVGDEADRSQELAQSIAFEV